MQNRHSDDPDVELVTELVVRLNHAVTSARLYGWGHPEAERSVAVLNDQLRETTTRLGRVTFETTHEAFHWEGREIRIRQDEAKATLGSHLHTEGISKIWFDFDTAGEEVRAFLELMGVNFQHPDFEEETLESLLWQGEFKTIGFEAVNELMEAEAISGRAASAAGHSEEALIRDILEAPDSSTPELNARILHDSNLDVTRRGDLWSLAAEYDPDLDDEEWETRLAEQYEEDLQSIRELQERLVRERPSEIGAQIVLMLLQAASANRPDLVISDAVRLARGAVRSIYSGGDPVGLLTMIRGGHRFAESLRERAPQAREAIRRFLTESIVPIRIARMLHSLQPEDAYEASALQRLVAILPMEAVLAFIAGLQQVEDESLQTLYLQIVDRVVGDKLLEQLRQPDRVPVDQLPALIALLRARGGAAMAALRPRLLAHPTAQVRENALGLFVGDLPEAQRKEVASLVLDRSSNVRRRAIEVLLKHPSREAARVLEEAIRAPEFHGLDRATKGDVCTTFARIGGLSAIPVLGELLNTRLALFGQSPETTSVEAAAQGLAAAKNPNATRILEKGSRALVGARRNSCQLALARDGGGDS